MIYRFLTSFVGVHRRLFTSAFSQIELRTVRDQYDVTFGWYKSTISCTGSNGDRTQGNSRRGVSSPTRRTAANSKQKTNAEFEDNATGSLSPSRPAAPAITYNNEEGYDPERGDDDDHPRRAPISADSHADQYSVSSSSSLSHISYSSSSSSTPLSTRHSNAQLGRTGSVVSAPPPSSGHLAPPALSSRRSSIADVAVAAVAARSTPLPPGLRLVAGTPEKSGTRMSTSQASRYPPRKPKLNRNPHPPRSLFCLTLSNPLRKLFIRVVEHKYPFTVCVQRYIILYVINIIYLALHLQCE